MPDAADLYVEGLRRFARRDDFANVWKAIQYAKVAERDRTVEDEVAYDVFVLHAKCRRYQALAHADRERRQRYFSDAMAQAEKARRRISIYAEAHYLVAAITYDLSAFADSQPRLVALLKEALKLAGDAKGHPQRDLDYDGMAIDGYGPDRLIGRILLRLPAYAGGSVVSALIHLRQAWKNAPTFAINAVYLAEALADERDTIDEARQILDGLLREDIETFNPSRVPETKTEFAMARTLRLRLG